MHLWFKSYLTNRKQYVMCNGVCSNLGVIGYGVPQGSVLGPLLFLLYINDIHTSVPDNQLKLFADDTNLFLYGQKLKELEFRANTYLSNMHHWFVANKLSLNIDKTCYTVFSKGHLKGDYELNLYLGMNKITKVSSCKYLGMTIDDNLKWDLHVDVVYKKLMKFTGIFYKLRNVLPQDSLKRLYYAFVHPHLIYGIEVYGSARNSVLDKLNKLNNKILRILQNKKTRETPVKQLYRNYNTLPITELYKLHILTFVHKCMHHKNLVPSAFHN